MKTTMTFFAANAAGNVALDYSRPALVGTDKQIAWATEIRTTVEKTLIAFIAKAKKITVGIMVASDNAHAPVIAQFDEAMDIMVGASSLGDRADALFANTSAKFWIDNSRMMDIKDLLIAAI